jgi:hypothetical protein
MTMALSVNVCSVFASSDNYVNKTVTVKKNKAVEGQYVTIVPNDEVVTGDSIVITFTNCELLSQDIIDGTATNTQLTGYKDGGYQWHKTVSYTEDYSYEDPDSGTLFPVVNTKELKWNGESFLEMMSQTTDSQVPYKIKRMSGKEMEVELCPIPSRYANNSLKDVNGVDQEPRYQIPIPVIGKTVGTMSMYINSNSTTVSEGTITLGTCTETSGSTTLTVSDVNNGVDSILVDTLTLKETVAETFKWGETVKLRLTNGFNFSGGTSFTVSPGTNIEFSSFTVSVSTDDNKIEFDLPGDAVYKGSTPKAASIIIDGIVVVPEDDDDDWGDCSVTISGAGCTKETILIATRTDYGFEWSASGTANLISGRRQDGDLDDEYFESAEITFAETVAGSWITSRKLTFEVPEGVHIFDVDFSSTDYINSQLELGNDFVKLNDDGTKLYISGLDIDEDEISEMVFTLYLSADAQFNEEVPLSITGGGVKDGALDDLIIANFIPPVAITTSSTNGSIGVMANPTADIVLTENREGALIEDNKVKISLDSAFGGNELGFCDGDKDIKVEVTSGDLEIKSIRTDEGYIEFTIDSESTTSSVITISNCYVGTTRAVPSGSYNLKVTGDAVINNYSDDSDKLGKYGWSNVSKKIVAKNYFIIDPYDTLPNMDTVAALSNVVKVYIDQTKVLVNEKEYSLDVAPFIQTASSSTLVPLRFVTVALNDGEDGASDIDNSSLISWDPLNKIATIFIGNKIIQFTDGSGYMKVGGTDIMMDYDAKAEIKDGRMFIPFRALGNALGVKVDWYENERMAVYNDNGQITTTTEETTTETTTESTTETTTNTGIANMDSIIYRDPDTNIYHLATCPDVNITNLQPMMKEVAVSKGYTACKTCEP